MAENIPALIRAVEDKSATNKVARSFDNLSRPRDVVLAATLDARSIASATKPLGAIRRSADEFEKSMAAANARVLAFGTSVAVIEGMRRSLLALVKTTASVENALTQISVVAKDELDAAGVSINQIGQQIFETARKTGQSVDSVSKTFLEFSRQGLKPVQTLERTKTALDLVRISGAEQEKVISGLTAAYNSFSSTGITFTQIAEKLVNVDNKTTTSVEGLVDVLARASSTAKLTGTSLEELLAITATLKDVTARSESVIGNAYRSISARLIDPEILKNLEELGVKTREFDGGPLLKTIGILTNVASKLKEIADPSLKTEIVKSISGLYQFDQLSALITALEDVNNLQGFYQKNLSASTEKSKALENASKAFSETLVNKFNAVDTTIQQVLNSIGQLGIKDPLSSLLDNITEIGNGLTSLIDGEGAGSSLAKFFIKGFSSIVLGPTGIVTIGFAISKIIFDFGKFAVEAGRSFLSLNKTAKDQELIQKSILTTISQMPSIMNGIENTEQGRLLLAQRISLLYEKQLRDATLIAQITSGAAPKVYSQGFRVGDSGLKNIKGRSAASGYLPDLVNRELSDVRKGVGGASPDSKVVVMPNFPFGGGKKGLMVANSSETILKTGSGYGILNKDMMGQSAASGFLRGQDLRKGGGKFANVNNLEIGLDNLVQLLVGWEKSVPEIKEATRNYAKSFELNEKSLDLVVESSVKYASSIREAQKRIIQETNQDSIRRAIGRADQTIRSAPEKRESFNLPIVAPIGGQLLNRPSQRAIENALKESSLKLIIEAANQANQKVFDGIIEKRKEIADYIKKNPPNPLSLARSRTSLPGRDTSGNKTFSYLFDPIRYSGPTSSDPLTRATEIGRQREIERISSQPRGLSISPSLVQTAKIRQTSQPEARRELERLSGNLSAERNYRSNPTAAFGGRQRLDAQPLAINEEANKKAQSSLESFATKAFIASAAVDFIAGQFRGQSEQMDKFAKAASNATIALIGFQFLSRKGGADLSSIGNFIGSAIGKVFGKGGGLFSSLTKGLSGLLPVLGQIGLAGFALNEFSKVFLDKSIFESVKEAFTGLSEAGERAKEKFNEIASGLFSETGQLNARTSQERRGFFNERAQEARTILAGESRGIKTSGKSAKQIAEDVYKQTINDILGSVQTGNTRQEPIFQTLTGSTGGAVAKIGERTVNETFADISGDAGAEIRLAINNLISGDVEEIKKTLKGLGIENAGGKSIENADIDSLRKELGVAALNGLKGSVSDIGKLLSGPLGQEQLNLFLSDFIPDDAPKTGPINQSSNKPSGLTLSREALDNLFKLQTELNSLVIDGSISSLEAEIKNLEFKASGNISSQEKNNLLNRVDKITNDVFKKRIQKLEQEFQSDIIRITDRGEDDKRTPQEINAEVDVRTRQFENQKREIENSIKATRNETNARNDSFKSFQKLNPIISNLERSLSRSAVGRAQTEAELALIQAQASNPALGARSQEGFQRQSAAKELELLQRDLRDAKTSRDIALTGLDDIAPDKRNEERNKILDAFSAQEKSINGQIAALNETTNQIGVTKSSFVALDDAIFQFTQTLGESRGQNQFNLLQATDPNAIVQGLIGERVYDETGNRQGAELISFIAQQNALLNEQFKIKTAASETERLELQRSYDLTKELIEIRNSGLDPIREQAALEKAINDNLEKRRTFGAGVEDSTAGMRDRIQSFNADFGRTATDGFKDALSGAIKAAVSETTNLKDALLDVALQFANSLRDKAIDNLADIFTNSLFGKGGSRGGSSGNIVSSLVGAVGGLFKGYASGGQVTGGSGTKDDVPTLLMGGEYVIPKNVVQSYGKGFFDRLRDGSISKMAQGGYFAPGVRGQGTISGKENLLDFATQTATSGKGDVIASLGANAGLVSLEPESLRLSNFARFGDSPILQASQETKEQAFGLYLDQLSAEKEYQKYLDDLKKAEKEKMKQLWISLAVAAVGAGVGAYGSGAGAKAGTTAKALSADSPAAYNAQTGLFETIKAYQPATTQSSNAFSRSIGAIGKGVSSVLTLPSKKSFNGQSFNSSSNPLLPVSQSRIDLAELLQQELYSKIPTTKNSGGAVSGNGDTVPAMLSNKEFVLNSSAAQKIGYKDLYAMNSGANPSGGDSETRIVAKLDELIEKTVGASNISVNVSMTNSGETNQQDSSQQSDSNASERQRFLTQRLKETVISVLREEQRPGGLLTSTRR